MSFLRALGIGSGGPEEVTAHTAMGVSAVYRAVSLISGTVGTLPLRTLAPAKDGTQTVVSSFLDSPGGTPPNPTLTAFEWKELVAVCLLLHGNAYAQKIFNANGAVVALDLLQPTAVKVTRAPEKPGGRNFCIKLDDGTTIDMDARQIVHIPGISLDGVSGVSPIALARLGLSASMAGDKASFQRFSSGAMISGMVTPADDDMDPDDAKAVKETVNGAMLGPENAGAIAVINRKLTFTPWMMNNADAQFLESREFQIAEIGRWFGIPPHLLGSLEKTTSWGTGIEEQNRGLARYTLQPWTTRIEQRLSLLVPGSRKVEFNYAQLLAPSVEQEVTLLLAQVNGGLITVNEARRVRNLPPVDGGDTLRTMPGGGETGGPRTGDPAPVPEPAPGRAEKEPANA